MVSAQLIAIAGAIVLLYVLIKCHLYAVRKLWVPKFEEEIEETDVADDDASDEDDGDGGDDLTRGWDVVR